jgi:hypothetical protein
VQVRPALGHSWREFAFDPAALSARYRASSRVRRSVRVAALATAVLRFAAPRASKVRPLRVRRLQREAHDASPVHRRRDGGAGRAGSAVPTAVTNTLAERR